MGLIKELLCMITPPPVDVVELKKANFQPLVEKSMGSATQIMQDTAIREQVSARMQTLLAGKSHTAGNTMRTVQQMFDVAAQTCHHNDERNIVRWLEFCVTTAVQMAFDDHMPSSPGARNSPPSKQTKTSTNTDDNFIPAQLSDHEAAPHKMPKRRAKKKSSRKSASPKQDAVVPVLDTSTDDERLDRIGESDDDYIPSDENDDTSCPPSPTDYQQVPKPRRSSPRKKSSTKDQEVPDYTPAVSAVKAGGGPKAIAKYFVTLNQGAGLSSDILPDDYFINAFFFPSKDSFNAFISVIDSARDTIDICVFSITDDDVADALISANQRGVKVRIITDNRQAAIKGADAARLQADYGIPYKTDRTTGYMHNKFAIIDHATLINGSFNWSNGARFKNRENIMITNIPTCITQFDKQFEALWAEF
ncbi:uncharacterized protein BYT42DRAFT_557662 [Radiomyces spectabilis]|uniref:uncharacterized protein n=1 Tax=Radiomyces spectabilis TaxID=64574 RepID=UPI00221E6C16|nr:uncharacterized protein BYT42DRAFT_557662 [Radiomyces spectabilis]KAI8391671.1 hypothetical protein BYT42DRAFT_557662 [Radiomyces spectabilis]